MILVLSGCASITSSDPRERLHALEGISDPIILIRVACEDISPEVRLAAANRLTDQSSLAKVLADSKDPQVRIVVIGKLTVQNLLVKVACEDNSPTVRLAAANRLTDQSSLAKVLADSKDPQVRIVAIDKLTDQDVLLMVACRDTDASVRLSAVARLTDQALLAKIVTGSAEWDVRQLAFNKLDESHLAAAVDSATDPAVVLAAKVRLKATNWADVFAPSNLSKNRLGDVLGAVALVKDPQPTSESVVAACHTFIRLGDASRIPELRNLLLRFGDKSLAEDYLNCGQSQLHDAGVEWASAHGYRTGTGNGSHRVRWGSGAQ